MHESTSPGRNGNRVTTQSSPVERVVFCDFDGTITEAETTEELARRFCPDRADDLLVELYSGQVSLERAISRIWGAIESVRLPEILEWMSATKLRPGFFELADTLSRHGVPLVIVSGAGLRDMITSALGDLTARVTAIHALDVDARGAALVVRSAYPGNGELLSKRRVMALFPAREQVAIGNSITDLQMALAAQRVFARDRLVRYLTERGVPFRTWDTFFDVTRDLVSAWASA